MASERTELEWPYDPPDFFETPCRYAAGDFDLSFEDGRAVATLHVPSDPVSKDLEQRVRTLLEVIFSVRELQVHRKFKLEGLRTYQHSAGRKSVSISCALRVAVRATGESAVLDAAGNVLPDSKAARVAEQTDFLDLLVPKVAQSPTLRSMLSSYSQAVCDPRDELVHLYEVRDAICEHYGCEQAGRKGLHISEADWKRLGVLANVEPLEQGRHRGKHSRSRRTATNAELEEGRSLVRQWIVDFAKTL